MLTARPSNHSAPRMRGWLPSRRARVQVSPSLIVSQYDVAFSVVIKSTDGRHSLFLEPAGVQVLDLLPSDAAWGFDGNKILYTSAPLELRAGAWTHAPGHSDAKPAFHAVLFPGTKRQMEVTLTHAATLDFGNFVSSSANAERADLAKHYAALDVAFRQYSVGAFKSVGDAFYDERKGSKARLAAAHTSRHCQLAVLNAATPPALLCVCHLMRVALPVEGLRVRARRRCGVCGRRIVANGLNRCPLAATASPRFGSARSTRSCIRRRVRCCRSTARAP
jgi:hypothetical protein